MGEQSAGHRQADIFTVVLLPPVVNVVVLLQRTLRFLNQLGDAGAEVVAHLLSLLLSGVVVLAIRFHMKMSRHANYNETP